MRKLLCVCAVLLLVLYKPCSAKEINSDDLLSLVKLTPAAATRDMITSVLGKPAEIEENKKRTLWHYSHGKSNLVISWSNKSDLFEKFSFTNMDSVKKPVFDNRLQSKLQSGATDMMQAIKLLGIPKDMTVKGATQEMHYAFEHNVLRLFFRNHVLVDFCLY